MTLHWQCHLLIFSPYFYLYFFKCHLLHTVLVYLVLPTDIWCYLWFLQWFFVLLILCVLFFFLTEFIPKCYALLLMAFDRHTMKVYLLTYWCGYWLVQLVKGGAIKTGPPASLSHCKYSENSMTQLHGNWWTSAILYAEHSH